MTELSASLARIGELAEKALADFAKLEIPAKPQGNAGFYSIQFDRINRAREAHEALRNLVPDLAGLVEAMKASEWQPIETAPKDGREILCWPAIRREVDGVIPSAVGAWLNTKGGHCWVDMSVGHHNGFWKPTHWRPLPDPPSETARALGGDRGRR